MDEGKTFAMPDPKTRNAGKDCSKAVEGWRLEVHAAMGSKTVERLAKWARGTSEDPHTS